MTLIVNKAEFNVFTRFGPIIKSKRSVRINLRENLHSVKNLIRSNSNGDDTNYNIEENVICLMRKVQLCRPRFIVADISVGVSRREHRVTCWTPRYDALDVGHLLYDALDVGCLWYDADW